MLVCFFCGVFFDELCLVILTVVSLDVFFPEAGSAFLYLEIIAIDIAHVATPKYM